MQGAFAVACTQTVPTAGGLHGVLVWNLADLIQPDYVLECPFEVGSFAINPGQPATLAGGCITGQVLLWDCTAAEARPERPVMPCLHLKPLCRVPSVLCRVCR